MPDAGEAPVLSTQEGCAESHQVRTWLTERGIIFTERNVTGDLDAAKALLATGTFGTPLLIVGNRSIIGFRPDALTAALASPDEEEAR